MLRSPLPAALLSLAAVASGLATVLVRPAAATMFNAADLDQQRFVLVAAPIGDGTKAQLNIYEQLNSKRACFAVSGSAPAVVDPLLAGFDFTGICSRFIDANGYSVRVGELDLASSYRLMVVRAQNDNLLLAIPTKPGAGPEMVVARTQGPGSGFLQFVFEPGWQLKRRAYAGRRLGHVYLHRESWPAAALTPGQAAAPAEPQPAAGQQPAMEQQPTQEDAAAAAPAAPAR
jgi:hypothetical protein